MDSNNQVYKPKNGKENSQKETMVTITQQLTKMPSPRNPKPSYLNRETEHTQDTRKKLKEKE